jgi:hypothetical protein
VHDFAIARLLGSRKTPEEIAAEAAAAAGDKDAKGGAKPAASKK